MSHPPPINVLLFLAALWCAALLGGYFGIPRNGAIWVRSNAAVPAEVIANFEMSVARVRSAAASAPKGVRIKAGDCIVTSDAFRSIQSSSGYSVNATGTKYANGTTRGHSGTFEIPHVGISADVLTGYSRIDGGLTYVLLHESAHALITRAGCEQSEAMADRLAHALAIFAGLQEAASFLENEVWT